MQPLALAEPWDWLLGKHKTLSTSATVDGCGSPRLLTGAEERPSAVLPTGQASPLPPSSFPFLFGDTPAQAWHLPTDRSTHRRQQDFSITLSLGHKLLDLHQRRVVCRPPPQSAENANVEPLAQAVAQWIDWQVRGFQQLGQRSEYSDPDYADYDADFRGRVRRTWFAASEVWLKTETDTARMALIVQLSRDEQLRHALDSVSRHPRHILQRYRAETPLNRIQELDSACIRDFARRPGITAAEKAGPRQRLLAVLRREQRDTLENRITCWVMEAAADLAREYALANASFIVDKKVREVRSFGRRNIAWRQSECLADVTTLLHYTESQNYPLQFEPRYKLVWNTYNKIRREKWVKDDAWAWQRVLWGETGRQLIGCWLDRDSQFTPAVESTPFYRTEMQHGCWVEPPVAPGPFSSRWGDCLVFDSRDVDSASGRSWHRWLEHPPLGRAEFKYIGASGCDQLLLWPKLNRALLVWHFYHTSFGDDEGGLKSILSRCGQALEQLAVDIRRFAQSQFQFGGLLLVADLGRNATQLQRGHATCVVLEPGPRLSTCGRVNALCVPPDVDAWERFVPDFREGFQLVLEELLDGP